MGPANWLHVSTLYSEYSERSDQMKSKKLLDYLYFGLNFFGDLTKEGSAEATVLSTKIICTCEARVCEVPHLHYN